MCLEIDYDTFKADCEEIIGNYLKQYGFENYSEHYLDKGDLLHTALYKGNTWLIEISMISNFPYVGASLNFLNYEELRVQNTLFNRLKFHKDEERDFYEVFSSNNDMNEYENQLVYTKKVLEKFYQPILTGEFTFEDYERFASNQEA